MREFPLRRVARLEQLVKAHLKRKEEERENSLPEFFRQEARDILANLACLILYGEPKIDEPLRNAWERCCESAAWQACREKHGDFDAHGDEYGTPFHEIGVYCIAGYFREYLLIDLPGADEIGKYNAIFKEAPPWLLWFTHADVAAYIAGVELPDLSEVSCFARGEWLFKHLPPGPFQLQRLPDGVDQRFIPPTADTFEDNLKNMTPRERRRIRRIYETCASLLYGRRDNLTPKGLRLPAH